MSPRRIILAILGLAFLVGWLLAPPGQTTGIGGGDGPLDLPQRLDDISKNEVEQALASVYRRQVWSAGAAAASDNEKLTKAEREAKAKEEQERTRSGELSEPEVPEGLGRFTLVGIIRVQGRPAEALLIDAQAQANDEPGSLRAREGEFLQDSGIRLTKIEGTRVKLTRADNARWLTLFRRPEPEQQPIDELLEELRLEEEQSQPEEGNALSHRQ